MSGINALPHIFAVNKHVFGALVRNKNGNVVVMEGIVGKGEDLERIELYWLDLDPAYKRAARESNKPHDRDEFSMMDHVAYGFQTNRINATSMGMIMKQLPHHTITVRYEGPKIGVKAYVMHEDQVYRLQHIRVNDTVNMFALPTVDYVDVTLLSRHRQQKTVRVHNK